MKFRYIFIVLIIGFGGFLLLQEPKVPVTFMATTTTRDAGLLDIIIPELEKDTGLDINVVAFGTSKVLRSAADGNADIILVHDPINEKLFIEAGYGTERLSIMQNSFVIVGPPEDPAGVASATSANVAFQNIFNTRSSFVSRGDQSGTHNAEQRIWKKSKIDPTSMSGENYILTGSGMGRTLNIAVEKSAYVFTDRATWLTFKNKGDLILLFEDDPLLENVYSIVTVNPDKHTHISAQNQTLMLDWFKSVKLQKLLNDYKALGKPLFKPI